MTVSAALVFWVLVRQPQCWADRDVAFDVKVAQLANVAAAISAASSTPERAAMLLTIGYNESRWCMAVGSGAKRGGRGEGYWQLEGAHHGDGARSGLAPVEVASAAALASAQLDRSGQCGPTPAGILTAYAGRPCWQASTGTHCGAYEGGCFLLPDGWPTLDARVSGYWWAVSALRRAQSEVHP